VKRRCGFVLVVRTTIVAILVFLFCGLVLPAPQNDAELRTGDPSAVMVVGAHQARVTLKQAPQRLLHPMLRILSWILLVLALPVLVVRLGRREHGWSVHSLLHGTRASLRGPPLAV
jgi:hypothetical protein